MKRYELFVRNLPVPFGPTMDTLDPMSTPKLTSQSTPITVTPSVRQHTSNASYVVSFCSRFLPRILRIPRTL